jgi:uncharacterized SAM-binding protein YcdF (DUF218 family)
VKPLLLSLAMPPTGLLTLLLVGLLLDQARDPRPRRWGRVCAWAGAIGLYLLATPLVSQTMLVGLERHLPTHPPADHPPRAIVVLGGELIRTPSMTGGVRLGPLSAERALSAAALARSTGLPILVSGGLIHPDVPAVSTVMAESLKDDFGLAPRWTEDRSADTWENARLSAAILKQAGIDSIYLVTTAWHMRRALLAFQRTGLIVTAAPTPLDREVRPFLSDVLPLPGAWQTSYYALHEWIGYAWYRVR